LNSNKSDLKDFWLNISGQHFNGFVETYETEGVRFEILTSLYTPFIMYTVHGTGKALLKIIKTATSDQFFIRRDEIYKNEQRNIHE